MMAFCLDCGKIHDDGECQADPDDTNFRVTPAATGVQTIFPPRRLNPVCPVCGEDEPGMGCLTSVGDGLVAIEPPTWSNQQITGLQCICRRCAYIWEVEPLSKLWEERDDVAGSL